MRRIVLAGLAVASLTGIAYAQAKRPDYPLNRALLEQLLSQQDPNLNSLPKTCVDQAGQVRNIGDATTISGDLKFECMRTFGDGLKPKGADWVLLTRLSLTAIGRPK